MHTHAATDASARTVEPETIITMDIDRTVDLTIPPNASASPESWQPLPRTEPASSPPQRRARQQFRAADEPQARLPLAPGRVLRDRYVLTQILGVGGMCTVFRARDLEANGGPAFVALKTPRSDYADQARAIDRLKREFECARNFSHGSVVQVFDLSCDGDIWFMTMELLQGKSLAVILRNRDSSLTPHLTRRVLRGIGDALGYAHARGVAHGDLNPANVFVLDGDRIKLIDFGSASRPGEKPSAAATLAYASAQVLAGETPTPRDDMFSFGCIAYEVLTGTHPFEQRPITAARDEGIRLQPPSTVSNEQALALMAALSFEREPRPDDPRAFAKSLAPDPPRDRTYAFTPEFDLPPPAPQQDKRWWIVAGACLVAMIVSVIVTRLS